MLSGCPDDDTLAQLVGRMLCETQRAEVETHCEACSDCRETVTYLVEAFAESLEQPDEPFESLPALGTTLGRYVILQWVGAGAMGAVYSAFDPELDRRVALKILPPRQGEQALQLKRRFLAEARAMASISHPNVIAVHDVGTHDGLAFFAMELIEGDTLEGWLKAERRSTEAIVSVFAAAGRGLAAAHDVGLVHRDFKPHNVLVGNDGRVRVIDFGLVRVLAEADDVQSPSPPAEFEDTRTLTGALLGTPAYMAPEQLTASHTDAGTDQFAFCVALFEALFVRRPFEGSTIVSLLEAIEAGPPRIPTERRRVSGRLRRVLQRGLAARVEDRHASMAVLLEALSDRSMARWGLVTATAAALLGIGFAVHGLSAGETDPRCLPNTEQLTGIWDPSRRRAVLEAVAGDASPGSAPALSARWLADRFERYSERWLVLHHEVCVATVERHEQSAVMMDAKMACLRRARDQLRAHVEQTIEAGESAVPHAVRLGETLPDLTTCDDAAALSAGPPPPSAEQAEAVEALRRKYADGRAKWAAGDYDAVLTVARELEAAATKIGYAPLRYEAALLLARTARLTHDHETTTRAFDRALHEALGAHDWSIAIQAATLRACYASTQEQPQVGLAYGRTALGLVQDPRTESTWVANAHKCMGRAHRTAGDLVKAEEHHRHAVSVLEQRDEPSDLALANARAELGMTLVLRSKVRDALALLRQATETLEHALGVEHPGALLYRAEMISAMVDLGEYDTADAEYLRLIDLMSSAGVPDVSNIGIQHAKRARLFYDQHQYDKAVAAFEIAKTHLVASKGPDHPTTLSVDASLANIWYQQGDLERARTTYRAVLEKLGEALPAEHPMFARIRIPLAEVEIHLGNLPEAIRILRSVTRQCGDDSNLPAVDCGASHLALARGLFDQGDSGGAARSLDAAKRCFGRSERAGDRSEAISELERDLKRDAEDSGGSVVGTSGTTDGSPGTRQ